VPGHVRPADEQAGDEVVRDGQQPPLDQLRGG
jgi:hypothetical protein